MKTKKLLVPTALIASLVYTSAVYAVSPYIFTVSGSVNPGPNPGATEATAATVTFTLSSEPDWNYPATPVTGDLLSFTGTVTQVNGSILTYSLSDLVSFHLVATADSMTNFSYGTFATLPYLIEYSQGANNHSRYQYGPGRNDFNQIVWQVDTATIAGSTTIPESEAILPTMLAGLLGFLALRRRKQASAAQQKFV